jgi:hypothetical protein
LDSLIDLGELARSIKLLLLTWNYRGSNFHPLVYLGINWYIYPKVEHVVLAAANSRHLRDRAVIAQLLKIRQKDFTGHLDDDTGRPEMGTTQGGE